MPDWAIVFLLAIVLLIIGVFVLRRRPRGDPAHDEIIRPLERIERRLDER